MRKLFLFISLLFNLLSFSLYAQDSSEREPLAKPCGQGTEECPYHIKKAGELLYFASVVNGNVDTIPQNNAAYAVLDADIDLSTVCSKKIGTWNPIGYNPVRYEGVFDGRNHKITNIYLSGLTFEGQGLFGIGNGCVIKNVILASGVVSSKGISVGGIFGAGIATIINCHNYATVISDNKFNGGIGGYMGKGSMVRQCHNEGTITSTSSNSTLYGVGGIAGAASTDVLVTDCYNLGKITGNSSRVGGVIGSAENCHVVNCYSIADVESRPNDYGGGLCAIAPSFPNTIVEHSYYYNRLEGSSQQRDMWRQLSDFEDGTIYKELNEYTPNIWRQETNKYPVFKETIFDIVNYKKTTANICAGDSILFLGKYIKNAGTYTADCSCNGSDTLVLTVSEPVEKIINITIQEGESYKYKNDVLTEEGDYAYVTQGGSSMGCDSTTVIRITVVPASNSTVVVKPCGEGTSACPYHIKNAKHLLYFASVVNGDIDTITQNTGAYAVLDEDIDLSTVCSKELGSWKPIGRNPVRFTGVFDGRNHKIQNIYMNGWEFEGQGLFGLGRNCEIKNVIIASGVLSAKAPSVGAIVGVCTGKITNCHNYATVINNSKFNGGIVGYMGSNSLIKQCHNEGNITSTSSNGSQFGVGGIAGAVSTNTLVTDCYNLGKITGNSSRVGGVIGSAENCHVVNCYSIADVESRPNDYGGGLCAIAPSYPNTKVEHSFYYNRVEGSSQQRDMWRQLSDFEDGTIYKELEEYSANLWRQEPNKYPVFKDTIYEAFEYKTEKIMLCQGDSILFNGEYIKEAGTYMTSLGDCNCVGNDTLIVEIAMASRVEITATITKGGSYKLGDEQITEGGTYTRTFKGVNVNGCDSTVVLHLTEVDPVPECTPVSATIDAEICKGKTYLFAGKEFDATGVYSDTSVAANGCDSTTKLNLTVHPQSVFKLRDTITAGESYNKNNFNIEAIGQYGEYTYSQLAGVNQYGCDSMLVLVLTVNKMVDGSRIPTLFTPYNGDNINDIFMKGYEVMIYDRYGNLVCDSQDGWDGTYRGEIADPGVYIYIITMKDGKKKKGSIQVYKKD